MQRNEFNFHLPPELIAQRPPDRRGDSRLLTLDGDSGALADRRFVELLELLRPEDLLVFNDTRVIPARIFGHKATGGRVEVLVERLLDEHSVLAHIRASKPPRPEAELTLDGGIAVTVTGRRENLFELGCGQPWLEVLEAHGHIPLPPYIQRPDDASDARRYQTVYARHAGAVAAPTAGLHFDETLLEQLGTMGVERAFVTLHVGAGTFQPVRAERIEEHRMHGEIARVEAETCRQIAAARERGGRIVAVGTTSVRSLESATGEDGVTRPFAGETRIFIYPGYRFRCVDALLTNFHLPESTLLMLVAAFVGHAPIMAAYRHAVEQGYRFFSYGDAMFLTRSRESLNA